MIRTLLYLLLWLPLTVAAADADVAPPIATSSLVSGSQTIAAGKPFRLALVLRPQPGWHTYWENPGDAGLPTTLEWTLPEGFGAGTIDWPPPQSLREGPLVTYGYSGEVLLPVTLTPTATLSQTEYHFTAKANWLICKEVCIPESAILSITLPAGDGAPAAETALFAEHDRAKPQPLAAPVSYYIEQGRLTLASRTDLFLRAPYTAIAQITFFPRQQNAIDHAGQQVFKTDTANGTFTLSVPTVQDDIGHLTSGLLAVKMTNGDQRTTQYVDITLTPAPTPQHTAYQLIGIMLFAALGGLILNLMPCVLPVLSLKCLHIAKKSGREHTHIVQQGLSYTFGILVSFAALAGMLIGLQQAGQAVGWGFQMQSPAFVGFLIYLLFLVGLNLSGVFHLPVILGDVAITDEDSARGSFFTGVLAAAVATPCTAPFMASAVGIALTLPPWQAMLVFQALGFGLALPFFLISLFPRALRFLPKPGAWMEKLKTYLAIPMYVSVGWLLWVLMLQTGTAGAAIAIGGMAALWTAIRFSRKVWLALLMFTLVGVCSLFVINRLNHAGMNIPQTHSNHDVATTAFSKKILAELRAQQKPIFLDATAAWCITCQVNARFAIHTDRVMHAFKEKNITLMVADWTLQNPEISELLASFGYQGVPLYVYFPPVGEPVILPQVLTPDIIINTIGEIP